MTEHRSGHARKWAKVEEGSRPRTSEVDDRNRKGHPKKSRVPEKRGRREVGSRGGLSDEYLMQPVWEKRRSERLRRGVAGREGKGSVRFGNLAIRGVQGGREGG